MLAIEILGPNGERSAVQLPQQESAQRWRVRLGCLPGASATQVPLLIDGVIQSRIEIESDGAEYIDLTLRRRPDGTIVATSDHRRLVVLPSDNRHAPSPPILPRSSQALDLCFVIDLTTRTPVTPVDSTDTNSSPSSRLLLDDRDRWTSYAKRLTAFARLLKQRYDDLRYWVTAFADGQIDGIDAGDLKPREYLVHPGPLRRLSPDALERALAALTPSPGGDFVDALGDALDAAVSLPWRTDARKLLVLSGDSPGFSLIQVSTLPRFADAQARRHDVLLAAEDLHQKGVEVLTIYHVSPPPLGVPYARQCLDYAREQYRRIASHGSLAFDAESFDPEYAASTVADWNHPIGRGSSYGVLRDVVGETNPR